jgi:hypothetical protein
MRFLKRQKKRIDVCDQVAKQRGIDMKEDERNPGEQE